MIENKYYTQNQLLEMANVSRNTLYRDIKSGKIKCLHFGRLLRFTEDEVLRYVNEKKNSKKVQKWQEKKNAQCNRL